jgi:hypothetical protein
MADSLTLGVFMMGRWAQKNSGVSVRRWLVAVATLGALALVACDKHRADQLVEDVSTEADVKRLFGDPRTVTIAADGTRTLEYPRQPEGEANYVMVIGADGKLKRLRQLLNTDNFAKVQPGMDREAVRQLLGPHARERRFELKKETLVEWRFRDGQELKVFGASFDDAGKVLSTSITLDERSASPGGK